MTNSKDTNVKETEKFQSIQSNYVGIKYSVIIGVWMGQALW